MLNVRSDVSALPPMHARRVCSLDTHLSFRQLLLLAGTDFFIHYKQLFDVPTQYMAGHESSVDWIVDFFSLRLLAYNTSPVQSPFLNISFFFLSRGSGSTLGASESANFNSHYCCL